MALSASDPSSFTFGLNSDESGKRLAVPGVVEDLSATSNSGEDAEYLLCMDSAKRKVQSLTPTRRTKDRPKPSSSSGNRVLSGPVRPQNKKMYDLITIAPVKSAEPPSTPRRGRRDRADAGKPVPNGVVGTGIGAEPEP